MLRFVGAILIVAGSFFSTLWAIDYLSPGNNTRPTARRLNPPPTPVWNEQLYLAVNADVAAAISRREFTSGRDHYERAGKAEKREGGFVPGDWREQEYLAANPDVAAAVREGRFLSGLHHYLVAGRRENRKGGMSEAKNR